MPSDVTAENITACRIDYLVCNEKENGNFYAENAVIVKGATSTQVDDSSSYTLGSAEAQALFADCVLPDFADSSLGRNDSYPLWDNTHSLSGCSVMLSFQYRTDSGSSRSFDIALTDDAARTLAFLQALGYPVEPAAQ